MVFNPCFPGNMRTFLFKVFAKQGLLYKVTRERQRNDPVMKDGITMEEFWDLLQGFFTRTLGSGDHNAIIQKSLSFVDFNQDGVVSAFLFSLPV